MRGDGHQRGGRGGDAGGNRNRFGGRRDPAGGNGDPLRRKALFAGGRRKPCDASKILKEDALWGAAERCMKPAETDICLGGAGQSPEELGNPVIQGAVEAESLGCSWSSTFRHVSNNVSAHQMSASFVFTRFFVKILPLRA